jgi:site-specific DNA-methyltransferase (adenine-specific)
MPLRRHEDILVFYNKTPIYNPQFTKGDAYEITRNHKTSNYLVSTQKENSTKNEGIRYPTSIIDIPHSRFKNGHPTQKPVNLFEYLILTYTNSGMTVLDNCIGSGTTAEACINTKRDFIGFEIEEQYCKMANERIEKIHNQNVS